MKTLPAIQSTQLFCIAPPVRAAAKEDRREAIYICVYRYLIAAIYGHLQVSALWTFAQTSEQCKK